jgi:hypothetical protein
MSMNQNVPNTTSLNYQIINNQNIYNGQNNQIQQNIKPLSDQGIIDQNNNINLRENEQ